MSHAEALHTLHPAAGATEAIVEFVSELRHDALTDEVRHYARRHLLDTVGVMIAGAGGEVATRAEAVLAAVRPAGPHPGARPRAARRSARCRLPRRHRGARHRARRRLPPGLGASGLRGGAGGARARLRAADHRRGADRGHRRRLRGRDRDRARLPSRPAPARIPSDGRGRRVRLGHGGGQAARAFRRRNSPTRSASPPRARPGCSPSSTAAPTSSACTPAMPRAKACRPRCWRSKASKARPT